MLKIFDFVCPACSKVFEEMVEGMEGLPEACPKCKATTGFTKRLACSQVISKIIIDYPGSKKFKAGYQHTHNLDAEKKGRQVSMHGAYKKGQ